MKQRIKILDFLRGIAILLVMLRHTLLTDITTKMGWIGVDLFFVLSGFLVSGLLFAEYIKHGSIKPVRFLIRRGFKIYPLFYIVLLLHIGYHLIKGMPLIANEVLAEVFFYQNYSPGIIGISWSLAIEEHFYLLLSLVLFILYKRKLLDKRTGVPLVCLFTMIFCIALRYLTWQQRPVIDFYTHFTPTHLRIDSLAFGVLIAWAWHLHHSWLSATVRRFRFLLLPAVPALLLPPFLYDASSAPIVTYGFTCLYLGFGILLALTIVYANTLYTAFYRLRISFVFNSIAWIGVYSYAIYLIHMKAGPMLSNYIFAHIPEIPVTLLVLLNICFNIAGGYILSMLIEKPFLHLREKYYPAN